jgi:hypothetical protein
MCHEIEQLEPEGSLGDARECDFGLWVERRLSDWPVARLVALERWLIERSELEFARAVRQALWQRLAAA